MHIPPKTKKTNYQYTIAGHQINDSYHWLEDVDDKSVKKWVDEQNMYFNAYIGEKRITRYVREFEDKFNYTWRSTPRLIGKFWYYQERNVTEQRPRYLRCRKPFKDSQLILDSNKLPPDVKVALFQPSLSGDYYIYEITQSGSEKTIIHIGNMSNSQPVDKEIMVGRGGYCKWLDDESGFYYKKPDPLLVEKSQPDYYQRIYFHRLGDDPSDDKQIFGKHLSKEYSMVFGLSSDNKNLVVLATKGWQHSRVFILKLKTNIYSEILKLDKTFKHPLILEDKLLIHTLNGAPNGKILSCSFSQLMKGIENWQTIVKPEKDRTLDTCIVLKNYLVCSFVKNVASEIKIYSKTGQLKTTVDLPRYSSVNDMMSTNSENQLSFSYSNFIISRSIVLYDVDNNTQKILQKPQFDLSREMKVRQMKCESKDGVEIPFFVVASKKITLNSNNPLVLYGYGGFGVSLLPAYNIYREKFLRQNGIYVVANIRGGGEFGKHWHTEGINKNKEKSFDDFIAVAKTLIRKKYTKPSKLAIWGGSNGGLLVSAAMIKEPKLFGAVIANVPLCDMYRFHKFLIASRWKEEYGDPEKPGDFSKIKKWSPYHNIINNTTYPPILLRAGMNDSRVHPMHAWKFAARLQEYNLNSFVYTDLNSGHTGGSSLNDDIVSQARNWAFIDKTILKSNR